MAKKVTFIFLILIFSQLKAEEIFGIPKIVDGDSLYLNKHKIRLEGIDAPEIKQKCKKTFLQISTIISFNFKRDYYCGVISKKELIKKIDNLEINCVTSSKDKYKRFLATCFLGSENLNKWMVKQGHAVAYKRYSKKYIYDEKFAEDNKLGIWKGSFLRPEKWRKLN